MILSNLQESTFNIPVIKKFSQITRDESFIIQYGMNVVSPIQTRSTPESLPFIHSPHHWLNTTLTTERLGDDIRLYILSLVRLGRVQKKILEYDII